MAKLDKLPQIDLKILKKLVENLEKNLTEIEAMKNGEDVDLGDFAVEMSKVAGLAAGLIQEGSMLVNDIQSLIKISQQPNLSKSEDLFSKILGGMKSSGSTN